MQPYLALVYLQQDASKYPTFSFFYLWYFVIFSSILTMITNLIRPHPIILPGYPTAWVYLHIIIFDYVHLF